MRVARRVGTDVTMLRRSISLSIFWKAINSQRRGLTRSRLEPTGRHGSAALGSVDTHKCSAKAPEEALSSRLVVHGYNANARFFLGACPRVHAPHAGRACVPYDVAERLVEVADR